MKGTDVNNKWNLQIKNMSGVSLNILLKKIIRKSLNHDASLEMFCQKQISISVCAFFQEVIFYWRKTLFITSYWMNLIGMRFGFPCRDFICYQSTFQGNAITWATLWNAASSNLYKNAYGIIQTFYNSKAV